MENFKNLFLEYKLMGIFNQHSNNQPQHQSFFRGLRGSPGVVFLSQVMEIMI